MDYLSANRTKQIYTASPAKRMQRRALLLTLVFIGALMLTGCDSHEDNLDTEIEGIAISPDTVSIEVGERMDFTVVALTASGDTVRDASLALTWWSTDPSVFTVDGNTATGRQTGTAYCMVEANNDALSATASNRVRRFVGRDSAFVFVP